jgi:hypothetical protein
MNNVRNDVARALGLAMMVAVLTSCHSTPVPEVKYLLKQDTKSASYDDDERKGEAHAVSIMEIEGRVIGTYESMEKCQAEMQEKKEARPAHGTISSYYCEAFTTYR